MLPTELQETFLKAQQLPTMEDRTSATMLLSCVLPDRNLSTLRHFFDFLHNVSMRCQKYIYLDYFVSFNIIIIIFFFYKHPSTITCFFYLSLPSSSYIHYSCFSISLLNRRSAENKMDSSNLSVILAPNILHAGDCTEKMNANTEKRLKLQAAIVHCFIENAHNFGMT